MRSFTTFYLIPYTLLGGAPHPPDPPGLKIHGKLNFQKIPRPNFQKFNFQKNFVNLTCVRWKGHSKWQNIQHTKAEKDGQRSKLAWTYNRKIGVAIRENGNETDPDRNKSLAR